MSNEIFNLADLAQFTESENRYRHGFSKLLHTDGVEYIAQKAGAYWLINQIGILQMIPAISKQEFQVWKVKVILQDASGFLTCEDGNGNHVYFFKIPLTDFPIEEITFFVVDNVMLLPSEY